MTEDTSVLFSRIKRKLAFLSSLDDGDYAILDRKRHSFHLEGVLPSGHLTSLEHAYGICFPEGYRRFVESVGSKGAGPGYGLITPSEGLRVLWDEVDETNIGELLRAACLLRAKHPKRSRRLELSSAGVTEVDAASEPRSPYTGCFAVAYHGCTFFDVMPFGGELRERVLAINADDETALRPTLYKQASFGLWYEAWLDDVFRGHSVFWERYSGPSAGQAWRTEHKLLGFLYDLGVMDRLRRESLAFRRDALAMLSDVERRVVSAYLGPGGDHAGSTLLAIGMSLGMKRKTVLRTLLRCVATLECSMLVRSSAG